MRENEAGRSLKVGNAACYFIQPFIPHGQQLVPEKVRAATFASDTPDPFRFLKVG
jgi:hypothetical protein